MMMTASTGPWFRSRGIYLGALKADHSFGFGHRHFIFRGHDDEEAFANGSFVSFEPNAPDNATSTTIAASAAAVGLVGIPVTRSAAREDEAAGVEQEGVAAAPRRGRAVKLIALRQQSVPP
jgi:hypothetical protein